MSSKTVAEKMYIKPGMEIGFFNAPDNLIELLGKIPDDVDIQTPSEDENLDFVLGFIEDHNMLEQNLEFLAGSVKSDGALWIAYYKGSSSVDTDINRDSINKYSSKLNLKGVAMVSINDDWSGFRFKKV